MSSERILLIDILSILPEAFDCYIQAPSLDDKIMIDFMIETENGIYKLLSINNFTKDVFATQSKNQSVQEYFQNIKIKKGEKLLFEGFDGVEFGILSKSLIIPDWFKKEYIQNGSCTISNHW